MRELILNIERVRRVNETHQHLILSADQALLNLKAGQSLLAHVEGSSAYLREQWFPISISKSEVVVERPADRLYMPATTVHVLSMIGQPFRYRRTLRSVLLIAYNTSPTPLLLSIPALLANQVGVTLVLLGSAASYKTEHIAPEIEVIIGDADFNWANRVTTVGWADQIFITVDPADELASFRKLWALFNQLRNEIPKAYLFGVFQPILPCGVGACGACMIRTKSGTTFACTQGPAFDLTEMHLT